MFWIINRNNGFVQLKRSCYYYDIEIFQVHMCLKQWNKDIALNSVRDFWRNKNEYASKWMKNKKRKWFKITGFQFMSLSIDTLFPFFRKHNLFNFASQKPPKTQQHGFPSKKPITPRILMEIESGRNAYYTAQQWSPPLSLSLSLAYDKRKISQI